MGQATVLANREEPKTGDFGLESCRVFNELSGSAAANTLVRSVVREDHEPTTLGPDEIARDLGDPFATLLLAKGIFPKTAEGVFDALDQVIAAGDVLSKESQRSFILGEGSQIPFSDAPELGRAFRFVLTRGKRARRS